MSQPDNKKADISKKPEPQRVDDEDALMAQEITKQMMSQMEDGIRRQQDQMLAMREQQLAQLKAMYSGAAAAGAAVAQKK